MESSLTSSTIKSLTASLLFIISLKTFDHDGMKENNEMKEKLKDYKLEEECKEEYKEDERYNNIIKYIDYYILLYISNDIFKKDELSEIINDIERLMNTLNNNIFRERCEKYINSIFNKGSNHEDLELSTLSAMLLGRCYEDGYGVIQDYNHAFKLYNISFKNGNDEAAYYLGLCYLRGKGTNINIESAIECLKLAADNDNIEAAYTLGILYKDAKYITKDDDAAFELFKKGYYSGHLQSTEQLSYCYEFGLGTDQNIKLAGNILKNLAKLKDPNLKIDDDADSNIYIIEQYDEILNSDNTDAMTKLGCQLCSIANQDFTTKTKIFHLFKKASELDDSLARYYLALCFIHGEGVECDKNIAFKLLETAYCNGINESFMDFASCLRNGDGCAMDISKALNVYKEAAFLGNTDAMLIVAQLYANGEGIPTNPLKAFKFYRKAFKAGNKDATLKLGTCYFMGDGVSTNLEKGFHYFKKSHEYGELNGTFLMAGCYYDGTGIKKDKILGKKWFQVAAEAGHEQSSSVVSELDQALNLKDKFIKSNPEKSIVNIRSHSHSLSLTFYPYSAIECTCDLCDGEIGIFIDMYQCDICDYNICNNCI